MVLELQMEVSFIVTALAAGVVVLHMVCRRVRMAQGRAMTLVIGMRTRNRNWRWQLVHGRLWVLNHLLLGHTTIGLLLTHNLALSCKLVAALAAGVQAVPVTLLFPLAAATEKKIRI